MKKLSLTLGIALLLCSQLINAQDIFKQHGFDKEPLTLSNGSYNEFFNNDEVVQIGTALLNTRTNKVTAFIKEETVNAKYIAEASSRWLSVDPIAAKYPQYSPYVFCMNNPILFIDPNGKEVVATNSAARQMILNTLTKEDRAYVQFNNNGQINRDMLNSSNSSSGNFQALQQLTNDKTVFEANVDNKFDYKNENGDIINKDMGSIQQGDPNDAGPFSPKTGEEGFQGVTQTPGDAPDKYNSTDGNVKITVNSGLSEKGKAENFAHEGYGHGFLFSKGQEHKHQVQNIDGKLTEKNEALKKQIIERINETEKNFESK
jgi:hypothetical protein